MRPEIRVVDGEIYLNDALVARMGRYGDHAAQAVFEGLLREVSGKIEMDGYTGDVKRPALKAA